MRVTAVTPIAVTVPFEREPLSFCFVRVDTDAGLVGYGEACDSFGCSFAGVVTAAVTDAYAPLLVDQEVDAVESMADRLRAWTRRRIGDVWVAAQACSAIELALWDIVGKASGRSVSALLGRVRDRVEVYASSVFLEEGPASWHADLLQPLLERGVRRVKVRIGPEWRADLATLASLRASLGDDVELMVDGSEIFTLATALVVAGELASVGVTWFEEPLPQRQRAAIATLARKSPVPLAYGEHLYGVEDALQLVSAEEADVMQPDASTCGGLAMARRMASVASAGGRRVVPHVAAGPVSLAANLHFAATVPAVKLIEYPFPLSSGWAALTKADGLGLDAIEDGTLPVPDGPGLGVDLDEEAAARLPYHSISPRRGFPDRFTGDR